MVRKVRESYIEHCNDCVHFMSLDDEFSLAWRVIKENHVCYCKKKSGKLIGTYLRKNPVPIPNWCPLANFD